MKQILFASAAAIVLAGNMTGDTVTSSTGSFSPFTTTFMSSTQRWINDWTMPASSALFWNNPSDDTGLGGSHMMNVGNVLTDTGGLAGTPAVVGTDTVAADLTAANGADPIAFNFISSETAYDISLLFADSCLDTGNSSEGTVFGYYVGDTYTPLYAPKNTWSRTGTQTFDPTTSGNSYGFYATVCYAPGQCETYTTGNGNFGNVTGAAGWNHFALFQLASGSYAMGFEDSPSVSGENLGDFNDVVVEIQVTPEPGTLAILGLGLAGLCLRAACSRSRAPRNRARLLRRREHPVKIRES
jgi:hypothetical protein